MPSGRGIAAASLSFPGLEEQAGARAPAIFPRRHRDGDDGGLPARGPADHQRPRHGPPGQEVGEIGTVGQALVDEPSLHGVVPARRAGEPVDPGIAPGPLNAADEAFHSRPLARLRPGGESGEGLEEASLFLDRAVDEPDHQGQKGLGIGREAGRRLRSGKAGAGVSRPRRPAGRGPGASSSPVSARQARTKAEECVAFLKSSSHIPKWSSSAGAPPGDLLEDGLVEDEKIIDREEEQEKPPRPACPVNTDRTA